MRVFVFTLIIILFIGASCTDSSIVDDTTLTPIDLTKWGDLVKEDPADVLILTLNLHTYQEKNQLAKLDSIAKVISDLNVDFVAFQECAQNRTSKFVSDTALNGIRTDNVAYLIYKTLKERYGKEYYMVWDWAHYGFTQYEEGVGILSRYPIASSSSKWISLSTSRNDIASRKTIMAKITHPALDTVNFFSAHTYWMTSSTDIQHLNQVKTIKQYVTESEVNSNTISIVCGDYNCNAANTAPWVNPYLEMVADGGFIDTFLSIHPDANNRPQNNGYNTVFGDYPGRIDYIFLKKTSRLEVGESQIVFTPSLAGKVSDHYGVMSRLQIIK